MLLTSAVARDAYAFTNGQSASTVIGQTNFTSYTQATTPSGMRAPEDVAFDSSGNLWVSDDNNNRILEFHAPFSTGESASLVIGQSSFTTGACAVTQTGLCFPYGIAFDPSGNLWVSDHGDSRVLEFLAPFSNGESASVVIGQRGFTTNTCRSSPPTQNGLCQPTAIAFDSSDNLYVADSTNGRVLEFQPTFSNDESASTVIGQTSFTTTGPCVTSASQLCDTTGVAIDSSGNLWVSDAFGNRVLQFLAPFSNGESASLVIGQPGFTTNKCALSPPTQAGLCAPERVAFDSSHNLWVSDFSNSRVLEFLAPFSNGESASLVIGQPGFTTGHCTTAPPTQSSFCDMVGIAFDPANNLWVADNSNNRVLEFQTGGVTGVPEFPLGLLALVAIGVPVLAALRQKYPNR
jgi:DNA-binding beta-propeller fold protein YncE